MKKNNRILILCAIFVATFMTSVEVTIVTTALPSIISQLHGLSFQSWIMSSYLLMTAIATPIYGKLADVWGRKSLFQLGLVLFTTGSLLSGLAPNIFFLIIARCIQGIGAGSVIPLTFTIIADLYSFKERAKIMAFTNTAWGLSALIGPLLGGFLVDQLSWHWVFFVNVPLGILVFVIIAVGYHETYTKQQLTNIDKAGITFLSLTLLLLLIGIQLLNTHVIFGILILIISGICLLLFSSAEIKAKDPIIPISMFVNQTFSNQVITATLLSGILICYEIYFPIWLQSLYHVPATVSGFVVTSSSVMWLLSSFFVGPLLQRFSPKKIILVVVIIQCISYLPLIGAGRNFPDWSFYIIAAISGAGMGVVISMNIMLCQHLVGPERVGSATAIITLGRSLGPTVMAGVYGATLNIIIKNNLNGVSLAQVNNTISSASKKVVEHQLNIENIILQALHGVFGIAILLFIVILITNLLDPNKKIIN
ncbi:MFS transporter [Liquorilactobacillus mali]|uniref:MFS transporter n=1 Tax=Liquorilactobacillus mali TaxID=1618 RepID=UPI002952ACC3|nr:MFS transporter [Liquorilactobacillus mali]MDV7757727.1 MFS transporter [Liquorilactobacillus mali]